jgi:hypothetical protein
MTAVTLVLSWWLVAQASEEPDRYKPHVVQGKRAPATRIEREEEPEIPSASELNPPADPRTRDNESPSFPSHRSDATHRQPHAPLDTGLSDVEAGPRQKLRPPELLAQALATPGEEVIEGQRVTLEKALARASDRQHQLKLAQAYWRLSTAEADYHWALDQRDKLALYTETHSASPGVQSARASARADVRDAQMAVVQTQQDLADLMGNAAEDKLPLAVDRPHVGDYRTLYDSVFAGRSPPPRIRLIHRTLPLRRKAIDAHSEAILATVDALESTGEDFQKSGHGLATVMMTLDQLKRERRTFMAAVRDYNQDIAEYAFAVASPNANEKTLVAMLIKTSQRAAPPARDGRVVPQPAQPPPGQELEGPREDPTEPPEETTSNYQPHTPDAADDTAVYQGLAAYSPAERVQKLAGLLHWDRALPPDAGEPTSLADCLRSVAPQQRLAVIKAFWRARESVARHQAFEDQLQQFKALGTIAIGTRDQPGVTGASVRLQAARKAAQAAVYEEQAALVTCGFDLTVAAGRRLDDPWLVAATPPHAGRYKAAADRTARGSTGDPRHWAKVFAFEHAMLEERGESLLQSDTARAALVLQTRALAKPGADHTQQAFDEPMPLDQVIRAVKSQTGETLAFLHDLTGYNLAIANYSLAAWPNLSSDELVKQLVVVRPAKRSG